MNKYHDSFVKDFEDVILFAFRMGLDHGEIYEAYDRAMDNILDLSEEDFEKSLKKGTKQ